MVGEVSKKLHIATLSEIMSEINFPVKSLEKLTVRYAVKWPFMFNINFPVCNEEGSVHT